jgi:arylformamidase
MIIHDISLTVTPETVTWENSERAYSLEWVSTIGPDSVANVSIIEFGAHTGTHMDSPRHFMPDGKTIELLDVETLVGPAQLVEIYNRDNITAEDLGAANIEPGIERILFKTDNTKRKLVHDHQFHRDYVGVAPSGATWLVEHGIRLVGIDYCSIGQYGKENIATHRTLLGAGVVVIETLVLDNVEAGLYTLIAVPPKFSGAEGSPCRAILLQEDHS